MVIEFVLLALALPVGFIIAWFARDEIVAGRFWFITLICASLILGIFFYIKDEIVITLTLSFIVIVSFISLMKSYDKTWVKKRI